MIHLQMGKRVYYYRVVLGNRNWQIETAG